jgi:hypothetical protein
MFEKPMGIALSPSGTLFVTDVLKKQILIFDLSGRFLDAFGPEFGPVCRLQNPVDVDVWRDRVFVLDKQQSAILVFHWRGSE